MPKIPGSYGVDAPYVPVAMTLGGVGFIIWGLTGGGLAPLVSGPILLAVAALYLYATLRGKFVVWQRLIDGLGLTGSERVVDVGCGRGLVLITAARSLTTGTAVGVDLWRSRDQSGNDPDTTMANARAAGVSEQIELLTADMRDIPLPDNEVDVVLSSVAVQNIKDSEARAQAIAEMYRILRPGGRLLIADIQYSRQYVKVLTALGAQQVTRRDAGWRKTYGLPYFFSTYLVSAAKAGSGSVS
jgi:ubiquinone/menaquinone biosynthesis C-methylase UbiE